MEIWLWDTSLDPEKSIKELSLLILSIEEELFERRP